MSRLLDTDSRGHVRHVRELVDGALLRDESGYPASAGEFACEAHMYLTAYVAQMGHADVQTAQRLARECERMRTMVEDHLG